jgi:hypothetical protein
MQVDEVGRTFSKYDRMNSAYICRILVGKRTVERYNMEYISIGERILLKRMSRKNGVLGPELCASG